MIEALQCIRRLMSNGSEQRKIGRGVDIAGPLLPETHERSRRFTPADREDYRGPEALKNFAVGRFDIPPPRALPPVDLKGCKVGG